MRFKNRAALAAATIALSAAGALVVAPAASAASTTCSGWVGATTLKAGAEWARARNRVCINTNAGLMQAVTQLQFDWPTGGGWGPKTISVYWASTTMTTTFSGGSTRTTTCNWGAMTVGGPGASTANCSGPWVGRSGYTTVRNSGISLDVKDDGKGTIFLQGASQYIN